MATQITLQDAMSIKDPAGNASFLDVRFAVLNNLAQGYYSYDMMTAADGEITGVGSVIYRIQHLLKAQNYEGNIETQNIVIEPIEVKINQKWAIGYEIEDMDLSQIIASPAIQAQAATNLATSIKATKNAQFFLQLKTFFEANPSKTYYFPELVSEADLTTDQYRSMQKKILIKRTKMANIINEKYVNVPADSFFGVIAPVAIANFEMLLTALNISSAAFDMLKYGIGGMGNGGTVANLGGTPFISDPFIGQAVEANKSFNSFAYDMTDYCGFLLHPQSVAYPSKWGKMQILPNPANLNSMVKAKWYTGWGILRPELLCAFTKKLKVDKNEVALAVGGTHQIDHSDIGNRAITYSSSASGKATVSNTGLITGVEAGEAVISIKEGETTLAEIAVAVA